jgi:hypothetical protein
MTLLSSQCGRVPPSTFSRASQSNQLTSQFGCAKSRGREEKFAREMVALSDYRRYAGRLDGTAIARLLAAPRFTPFGARS